MFSQEFCKAKRDTAIGDLLFVDKAKLPKY